MPITITDPFQDPVRLKRPEVNAYVDLLIREAQTPSLPLLYGEALRPNAGQWQQHFAQKLGFEPEGLVLEIGSHLGEVILKMAANDPLHAFIGMDITFKRVVKVAQKAQALQLPNITSILCNAKALDLLFRDQELDGVLIFFPDPWNQKLKQKKNRLIQQDFLKVLARKLKPKGFFWFKTDCPDYDQSVLELVTEQADWQMGPGPSQVPTRPYQSRFERLFLEQGLPTFEHCWHKIP